MSEVTPPIEFSRPFNVDRLQDAARLEHYTANEEERSALAKRFGIVAVKAFSADITLERVPDDPRLIDVRGAVTAVVVQSCIVTLEPVEQDVTDSFETVFAPQGYVERWLRDNPNDEYEAPEALDGSWLDLGELATQYLSLALDPYPRKEGVPMVGEEETLAAEEKQNPFAAALAKLKE